MQDNQIEISKFKDMLAETKVGSLDTTWEKELPKFIHDPRYRLIPQIYRPLIFEQYVKTIDLDEQRKKQW